MAQNWNYWSPNQWSDPNTGQSWSDTQYGDIMREQNLPVAYYRYGRELGIPDDGSAFSRWFSQQFPQVNTGYAAATIDNPYLMVQPYLNSLGGYDNWYRQFMNMAPQLRGEDPSGRGAGPVRWIPR